VPFPQFPELPDDQPMLALAAFLTYMRGVWEFLVTSKKHLLLVAVACISLIGICLRLWTDTALPLLADAVPMLVAIAGVVMSYKQPKRESHLMTTIVLFAVGVTGTAVMSWTRIRTEHSHNAEVRSLTDRMDTVKDQNTKILLALHTQPAKIGAQEAELERRQDIQKVLRGEYILSHENVSPGLIAGTEYPPAEWMNKRLRELGERWAVNPPSAPQPIIVAPEPKLARMQFSFWSDAPNSSDLVPIKEITVPLNGKTVTLEFTVGNMGEATAQNVDIWIRLCITCSFAREPEGFQQFKGMPSTDRTRTLARLSVNTWMEKMTAEVVPPPVGDFYVDFISSCDTCGSKQNKENFKVHVVRSLGGS
jgi:hypothetical protein